MVRNTPKNAEPTAKAKLPPSVRGLLCIGAVLLVCFVVSIVLEVWYCKSAANAAIKLAACLVLDAFAFLLPGVVATITAMHVIRKDKNKFRKQVRKPMPKRCKCCVKAARHRMGKLRCLPHSDHRGARCAPVTLRSLLWRNLRQSPPLRDDASIVPYKSCATFAAHGKAEFLCGGVHPYPLQGKIRFSTR